MAERQLPPPRMPPGQRVQRQPIWERQPFESAVSYESFCVYRNMGSARSLAKVGHQVGKCTELMERWSVAWSWVKRVTAWDEEQEHQRRLAQCQEVLRMNREHSAAGQLLITKAVERLQATAAADLEINELIRCIEIGSKVERLARGEVTDIRENRGNPEHPQIVEIVETEVFSRAQLQAPAPALERNGLPS